MEMCQSGLDVQWWHSSEDSQGTVKTIANTGDI